MSHQVRIAVAALVGVFVGAGIIVLGLIYTLPWLTRGLGVGSLVAQRGRLLRRVEREGVTGPALAEIEQTTRELLKAVSSQHMKDAVERELESVVMARQAWERCDTVRARTFLERVGRRVVRLDA